MDGTTEKALLGRFNIQGFPSIYHVQGTETRQFASERTLKKVSHFVWLWCLTPPGLGCTNGRQLRVGNLQTSQAGHWNYAALHAYSEAKSDYGLLVQLKHFALTGWEAEPALAFWQSPTSALGRSLGHIRG